MIFVNGFIRTNPTVVDINQEATLEINYKVTLDEPRKIVTTYDTPVGCTIVGNARFEHENLGTGENTLKDTLTVKASTIKCSLRLTARKPNDESDTATVNFGGKPGAIKSLKAVRVISSIVIDTGDEIIEMGSSKKIVHNFLKNEGYVYDKSKKAWSHGGSKK